MKKLMNFYLNIKCFLGKHNWVYGTVSIPKYMPTSIDLLYTHKSRTCSNCYHKQINEQSLRFSISINRNNFGHHETTSELIDRWSDYPYLDKQELRDQVVKKLLEE